MKVLFGFLFVLGLSIGLNTSNAFASDTEEVTEYAEPIFNEESDVLAHVEEGISDTPSDGESQNNNSGTDEPSGEELDFN